LLLLLLLQYILSEQQLPSWTVQKKVSIKEGIQASARQRCSAFFLWVLNNFGAAILQCLKELVS